MTRLKRIAIKQFCYDSAENATTPGGFWKRMKPLLPSTTDFSNEEINVMDDGKLVMEPSNLFNVSFSRLLSYLSQSSHQDFSSHLGVSSILAKDFHRNFSFHSISSAYIESLLGKIKCNKSCGPDNITPKILKLSTCSVAIDLTKAFDSICIICC